MNRSDLERLRDGREFAEHARYHAGGLPADILAGALQPQHAALFALVITGETLHRVSSEVESAGPAIEWRLIANLRNIVIHSYWQIDLEIIADIIKHRLEPLMHELDKLIAFIERSQT